MRRLRRSLMSVAAVFAFEARAADLEKPAINVSVGGKTLIVYLPLTIAERRGAFTKEGMKVEISDFQGGSRAVQALVGGSADIALGAYENTLHMAAKGQSIKAIALLANSFGMAIGVHKDKAASYQSLQSLKGMRIGVTSPGSASAIGLAMLLSKANMALGDVSVIGVGTGAAAVAAMTTAKIDAIVNFDPVISILQRDNMMKTILDTRADKDLEMLYGGPFAATSFFTDVKFIERNPKTTQAFVNAISATLDWMAKATTEEIVATVPAEYHAGDRALYTAIVESNRPRVSVDGRIPLEAAQRTYRNLAAFEETLQGTKIDVATTFDNTFAERAPALRAK